MNKKRTLELKAIRKYFPEGGVEALKGANFLVRGGEIHALVGENGAGKSTLMRIAAGLLEPSSGAVFVDGTERRFSSAADALAAGIGLVHQHPAPLPGFALWEDCALGAERTRFGFLDRNGTIADLQALSDRWGFDLDLEAESAKLGVSLRQKAAVLSLLYRGADFFLLDEPTAVLTPDETERLFALLRSLGADGRGIVLISHKLDEILTVADRVTILHHGVSDFTGLAAGLNPAAITARLFALPENGEERQAKPDYRAADQGRAAPGSAAASVSANPSRDLVVEDLIVEADSRPYLRGLSFRAAAGRIVAFAGVKDSGMETLELALAGFLPAIGGSISFDGIDLTNKGIVAFRQAGGAYVPADRMKDALSPRLTMAENLAVHVQDRRPSPVRDRHGWLKPAAFRAWAAALMREAGVSGDPRRPAGSFSGGSLQRLIVARELAEDPAFVVLVEPGWGLDAAARGGLERRLRALAAEGKAVLLLSSDLDELIALADEILVLRDGRIAARLPTAAGAGPSDKRELRRAVGTVMMGPSNG